MLTKIWQHAVHIIIFLAFVIFEVAASSLVQLAAQPKWQPVERLLLLLVGLTLSVLYVWAVIKVIRRRQPNFAILPINFKNFRKAGWLLLTWFMMILSILAYQIVKIATYVIVMRQIPTASELTSQNQSALQHLADGNGLISLSILVFCAVAMAPIMEELLFRGLFFNYFDSHKIWWLGPIFSGLIFGLMHVILQPLSWQSLLDAGPYVIMGVFMAYVYKKSGRISNDIALHFMQNSLAGVALILTFLAANH